jgi:geranylgeranyl diphosphate synthase type I
MSADFNFTLKPGQSSRLVIIENSMARDTRDLPFILLTAIEEELQRVVAEVRRPGVEEMYLMLAYHMGWEGEGAGPDARGKRIRPLLVLLAASAAGGQWQHALPAAAAVELVHNFSLIHDDIQDQSSLRRGRPTVWQRWGAAQAINAGDTLFSLAQLTLLRLRETVSLEVALRASRILQETCLSLTQGQHLDMAYQERGDLSLDAYWPMVNGKTAALFSACTHLGALVAQAPQPICDSYRKFGHHLGLAFQAQDDLLGIWGDEATTGKSSESDLLTGKKSLPILYGLSRIGPFAARWAQGPITFTEIPATAAQLEAEGARAYTCECAKTLTERALQNLQDANPQGAAKEALVKLTKRLSSRQA